MKVTAAESRTEITAAERCKVRACGRVVAVVSAALQNRSCFSWADLLRLSAARIRAEHQAAGRLFSQQIQANSHSVCFIPDSEIDRSSLQQNAEMKTNQCKTIHMLLGNQ